MSSTASPVEDLESRLLTRPIGWTEPPEYSACPSASGGADDLLGSTPEYSTDLLPDETFLAGSPLVARRAGPVAAHPPISGSRRPSPYNYPYKSLTLSLNSRSTSTQSPAYGYAEAITGHVEVRGGMKNVEKVQLTIQGYITTTVFDRGLPVTSTSKCVLKHIQTLYCSLAPTEEHIALSNTPAVKFPFSFGLPAEGRTRLPPSFYALYSTMEASVRYVARVDLIKKGVLRRNEHVEAVLLYLPKTAPPSNLPPTWYNRPSSSTAGPSWDTKNAPVEETPATLCSKEWQSTFLASDEAPKDLTVEFCLFKPLVYQALSPIPLSLHITSSTPVLADLILASAQATLLKRTKITVRDQIFVYEEVLGTSVFGKAEARAPDSEGRVTRGATGCLTGGRDQGEIAWHVEGMITVDYAIRVDIQPSLALGGAIPTYRHKQRIELTTNPLEDAENFDGALDGPAMGIVGRL